MRGSIRAKLHRKHLLRRRPMGERPGAVGKVETRRRVRGWGGLPRSAASHVECTDGHCPRNATSLPSCNRLPLRARLFLRFTEVGAMLDYTVRLYDRRFSRLMTRRLRAVALSVGASPRLAAAWLDGAPNLADHSGRCRCIFQQLQLHRRRRSGWRSAKPWAARPRGDLGMTARFDGESNFSGVQSASRRH